MIPKKRGIGPVESVASRAREDKGASIRYVCTEGGGGFENC